MRFLCRLIGHRWTRNPLWHATYAPRYYSCSRCAEPGFWIDDDEPCEPLGPQALALAKKNSNYAEGETC